MNVVVERDIATYHAPLPHAAPLSNRSAVSDQGSVTDFNVVVDDRTRPNRAAVPDADFAPKGGIRRSENGAGSSPMTAPGMIWTSSPIMTSPPITQCGWTTTRFPSVRRRPRRHGGAKPRRLEWRRERRRWLGRHERERRNLDERRQWRRPRDPRCRWGSRPPRRSAWGSPRAEPPQSAAQAGSGGGRGHLALCPVQLSNAWPRPSPVPDDD